LRCPSETLLLRWEDIDWDNERFTVTSPKTEHHPGRETRLVPIFPELYPYLGDSFELAEDGATFCITRYRDRKANLRTQLQKIVKRAGLDPWPKLWQNLRSTRETELCDEFPTHVAAAWIGNTVQVAMKHYLQVTDEHFQKAAQNAAQKVHETLRNDKKAVRTEKSSDDVTSDPFTNLHEKTAPCDQQETVLDGPGRTRTSDLALIRGAL
jgi:integrase